MQYSYCKILIGCLVLQVVMGAEVIVFAPMYNRVTTNVAVARFLSRDATIIDSDIAGELEYAAPSDACSPIAHPFFVPNYYRRNLVLINGTDKCDFRTKIKHAQAVGFDAAILFDPFPEPFNYSNITFPIKRSEINISVVLVSCEDGIKLQKYTFPESRKRSLFVGIQSASTSYLELVLIYVFGFVLGVPIAIALGYVLASVTWRKLSGYRRI